MVCAASYVTQDIVPFAITGNEPVRIVGINKVGLERRDFSVERLQDIKRAYKTLFREGLSADDACAKMNLQFPNNPDVLQIIDFVKASKRGILRMGKNNLED